MIGATHAPLNLCFIIIFVKNILKIFSMHHFEFFKNLQSFFNIIMLRFILKNFQNYVIKKIQISFCVFFCLIIILKHWIHRTFLNVYFYFIKLILNLLDMYTNILKIKLYKSKSFCNVTFLQFKIEKN